MDVEVGRIELSGREGIYILRERLEGDKSLLPCLTTAQRDTLTFKLGQQILNTTNDSVVEYWINNIWRRFSHTTAASLEEGGVVISEVAKGTSIMTDSANFFWDNSAKRLGVGTSSPIAVLDALQPNGEFSLVLGADQTAASRTDATIKVSACGTPHYTNAEEPAIIFKTITNSTENLLDIGGGGIVANAMTSISFWTGATNTTIIGSQRVTIDKDGNVGIGTTTPDNTLDIDGFIEYDNKAITLGSGVTTFAVTANGMTVTGHSGSNTIATIIGVTNGGFLTLIFTNNKVTITDDNSHAADSIDLNASFTSADDVVLRLEHDGVSWYEVSRSTN
ncbi:MAG: hypothetical protein ACUZ8E_03055 [Candidatus Anammoxibacter sp.]